MILVVGPCARMFLYAPIKLIDSSMHIEIKNTKILKNIYIQTYSHK
jgi:hypothetical protein